MVALDGELLTVDVVKPFVSEGYCKEFSFDIEVSSFCVGKGPRCKRDGLVVLDEGGSMPDSRCIHLDGRVFACIEVYEGQQS